MNIQILDSWLRDYVKTNATPKQIAEYLSLSSVGVERLEKYKQDYLYDIEVTTNRPDLMSLVGLARETATVLKQNNIAATFIPPKIETPKRKKETATITIKNDPKLVNRICAVIMEVTVKPSPKQVQERLESTDIRSLNNLIDITNYVMRVIGHPTHVFDYDRLSTKKLIIREAKPKEKIMTLDKKEYKLLGGDIVAENDTGEIVDLLGVMGVENSVVTNDTKRILFFIDNNDQHHIRKTSMSLGIRTEAAVLNEKALDPELAKEALLYGIKLFEELAEGKVISELIDLYPNKIKPTTVTVTEQQINTVIGVSIPLKKAAELLVSLGFETKIDGEKLIVTPPSFRVNDFGIPEDVIEEIARVYGYHNIPNILPPASTTVPVNFENNEFYWENRIKDALKYWGFTEVYTYPMVSENLYEGSLEQAVTIQNPLTEDFVYMRQTLVPSLLKVVKDNKSHDTLMLFEIGNVYIKKVNDLPYQQARLAGVMKKPRISFYEIKGVIEQLFTDLGITDVSFTQLERSGDGAKVFVKKEYVGDIEVIDKHVINFEFDMQLLVKHATLKKKYKPASIYPPILEDLSLIVPPIISTGEIIATITKQSHLIKEVTLLDKYQETRTFHIIYQSDKQNLTDKEVGEIRTKIITTLKEKYHAELR